jgi:dihydroneopterin aldolase/2-amino-4-hydroxy-6-hydroxymethyldihydropteridine diphosphokinase
MTQNPLEIELKGLTVHAHHGVYPEEKERGQRFVVDVLLVPASARAAESDRLEDAVDYGAVADVVTRTATERRYDLVERLAAVIGDTLLARFRLERVRVSVRKPEAPIAQPFDDVIVSVERVRARTW